MMSNLEIAIIGAGVVGLNTALNVQEQFPSTRITVIDDKFDSTTLSYGPAGIFRPSSDFGGLSPNLTKPMINYSFEYYKELLQFSNSGVREVSGYMFSNTNPNNVRNKLIEDILPVYREATVEERCLFSKTWKYGSFYETLMIQCSSFLPWAINRFRQRNGILSKRRVEDVKELENEFHVTFNCTGLGAKYLCKDQFVIPIRGQLVKVYAPWLKHFYYNDFDTYILPLDNGIVSLGGSRNYDSFNSEVDVYDTMSIKKRCADIIPKLADAEIREQWVGLRPHRNILRIEVEQMGKMKLVHNYGHGGYGITTAPGTAEHAVKLFQNAHSCSSKL